ncbi:unnamed protein product [Bursaphelenchus xylophilus]|uniref:(pine wood nematode) hypothetical protein n=1 Tax=Bursaphelenchus xylophilus TaxID=6326 RepID=A0A1I7RY16_BURXY|nr:unnamed protein product [Bursaphelenchus xylophilus]CAG9085186.1 unnamed protein product [Bursaphelenchus xylophilus]
MSLKNGERSDLNKSRSSSSLPFNYGFKIPSVLHVKSKFDSEFRRFCVPIGAEGLMSYNEFRELIEKKHVLKNTAFTLCYTSALGDLLPITNDENFHKAFESAQPTLRVLVQRKGESWEEKYGYGVSTLDRKKKGLSSWISNPSKTPVRHYNISNPEDFRQVSSIIDVDVVPETHRRVRLCKYTSDRPLGFYIRPSSIVRQTAQGPVKMDGIVISKLVEGGLAESTGLLSANDEIVEVNGIDVHGKTIDQVTDMMIANAHNLIITIKPANQRNTLHKSFKDVPEINRYNGNHNVNEDSEEEDIHDEVIDHINQTNMR